MLNSRHLGSLVGLLMIVGAAAPLSGCGGGGASSDGGNVFLPTGRVKVDVKWPVAGRSIPSNARSIRLQVRSGVTVVASSLVVYPNTTATITNVPVGSLNVRALAYASTDGTGVPLATADVPATVVDGATATVTLTLASTIDHLEYSPNPFVIGAGSVQSLTVTARDANGDAVLLDLGALTFSSSNTGLLAIAADGTVTAGTSIGSGTITVTDGNSTRTLTIAAEVKVGISVTPTTSTLNPNGTATFVATVIGSANTGVTWSVRESGGGTVSSSGVYTAPVTRGVYHVDATSAADPTRKASATIAVTSGSINAVIN